MRIARTPPFAVLAATALVVALAAGGCGGSSGQAPAAEPAQPGGAAATGALPAADKVLDDYVAATGGRAAYEKLETRVSTGTFTVASMNQPATFTMYQAAPGKMHLLIEMPGIGKEERGTDGQTAWSRSSMTGNRIVDGDERAQMLRTAALRAEIQWREMYKKVETVGTEDVGGRKAYKVAMHTPEGSVEHRYYDVDTKLLLRTTLVEKSPMGEVPVDSLTSDYRKVGGILLSHKAVIKAMSMEQVLTLEKVEHNVAIDPKQFEVPSDVRATPAAPAPASK
jgi:hypothetical protein